MSATRCSERNTAPTRDEIRDALSGNLCRCTGYTKIFDAVEAAATSAKHAHARPRPPDAAAGARARGGR
jgi:aerobic-type carbon monoxide dehydrogenase small subunit (CoxS/CutS family)